ncbi:Plant Tudor-like RNA-binding protein [Prunus dulcis]|uniref:Plant Tudor-like RNA-binding protein n=1 Tax=Prunus dulcis TaxID=3755 RepID=A0A4Y1RXI8_PRUDU|nr:Plant Tudor-like RNA-binding protein [Prunus dulcis]
MRFKSGSSVEVLSKKEMPSGSWCCAKIICGNGHNYTVRYDGFEGASDKAAVERVPEMQLGLALLHWKCQRIGFLVISSRLLGSSQEFKVGKFEIRVRQFWRDDKWVVIGKGLNNYEYGKRKNETHVASSHNLKRRSPYLYSQDVAYDGSAEKFRAVEREGKRLRLSDAESICQLGYEEGNSLLPAKEELAAEIHRAELGGLSPFFQVSKDDLGLASFLSRREAGVATVHEEY